MARKRKRRLTKEEVKQLRAIMDGAPQDKKPSIRQLAKHFGVNKPSILKSLKSWNNIQRNRPPANKGPKIIDRNLSSPIPIEGYTRPVRGIDY